MNKENSKKDIKEVHIKELQRAVASGPLKLVDIEIDCYVLKDGTPIMSKGKMMKAIGRPWKGSSRTDSPIFVGAVNIQPFISKKLKEMFNPIDIIDGNRKIQGYHAEILPLVADVYLRAREEGVLLQSQLETAKRCEIIVRSLSRVGITSLVYEATGFEKNKHPEALRMLVEAYLREEIRKWSKEFPDDLFIEMDRIYQNQRTYSRSRPPYYARFINKYIYKPIEKGIVLAELKKKNPKNTKGQRKNRHHQHLTDEVGLPKLKAQIWQIVGLLKISANKNKFENAYERLVSKQQWLFDDMID